MKIEIEKKYEIIPEDIKIIENNCEFIKEVNNKDYYLDTDEYILIKNKYYFRLRNGKYELKVKSHDPETRLEVSKEFDDEDEINQQLEQFNITLDDVEARVSFDTTRKKYSYQYWEYEVTIDVDNYGFGWMYEIELLFDDDGIDGNKIIEEIREKLWLTAPPPIYWWKMLDAAMYQNIELYELLTEIL